MPIISPTAISPHRIGGKSWSSYWTPLIIDYTDTQFVFKFKLPADKSITIAWGDGTTEDVSGNGDTIVEATSNYSAPGSYEFKLTGDWLKITYIDISNQSFVSGDVSNWANLTTVRQPLMAFVFDDGYKMDLSVA